MERRESLTQLQHPENQDYLRRRHTRKKNRKFFTCHTLGDLLFKHETSKGGEICLKKGKITYFHPRVFS